MSLFQNSLSVLLIFLNFALLYKRAPSRFNDLLFFWSILTYTKGLKNIGLSIPPLKRWASRPFIVTFKNIPT